MHARTGEGIILAILAVIVVAEKIRPVFWSQHRYGGQSSSVGHASHQPLCLWYQEKRKE